MDPVCSNCTYESDELDDLDLCQTCRRAYDLGFEAGKII